MRVLFPTTYLLQQCRIATNAAAFLIGWSLIDQLQISVIAEQQAQEGCNGALDIGPTFERAENYVSRMIRGAGELVTDVVHRSMRPVP